MAIYEGSKLRILIEGEAVFHATSCNFNIALATTERATKDTAGTEVSAGAISFTAGGEGLMVETVDGGSTSRNYEYLFDTILAKQEVAIEYSLGPNAASGDTLYQGTALLTSLESTAAVDEDATASFTLTGSGAPTKAVKA